jgi:hypothetical protein
LIQHAAMFAHCLLTLDVDKARKLWAHVHPELPQVTSDEEMLVLLHMARIEAKSIPLKLKDYSRRWLRERDRRNVAKAVGIAVGAPPHRKHKALAVREAMEDAVHRSIKAGIDIDEEATEVRARMFAARDKERGTQR